MDEAPYFFIDEMKSCTLGPVSADAILSAEDRSITTSATTLLELETALGHESPTTYGAKQDLHNEAQSLPRYSTTQ